jgi:tetratricopeptide (TPR) repeat protein
MDALKHHDEAVTAIRIFADQFSGNPDIRLMLVDLLREGTGGEGEPQRQHLEKLAVEIQGTADPADPSREGLVSLDSEVDSSPSVGAGDLVFIDLGSSAGTGVIAGTDSDAGPVEGLDVGRTEVEDAWRRDSASVDGLEFIRSVAGPTDAPSVADDLLTDSPFSDPDEGVVVDDADPIDIDAFPAVDRDEDTLPLEDAGDDAFTVSAADVPSVDEPEAAAPAADLVFLPVDRPAPKSSVGSDPALLARDRGRVLIEIGDRSGGIAALEEAVRQFEETGRWGEALQTAEDLTRLEPDAIFRYQKRVELAYRSGDRDAMLQSYLSLADALLRGGGVEHAITVYRRVLDHDPGNAKAQSALALLIRSDRPAPPAPPAPAAPPPSSFVDLGSLILDEPQNRDTRIRVDQAAPIEDEDQAFHEALAQFKRGIDENIDAEDFQAHYDLGIAFKEMGLLDEAIAQFQKALRSPEGRLKTSEQLGIAFYEKSRFAISEAVLRRAIDSLPGGDEDKIGLIYWLGRALEAQRRAEEALRYYERALAVDIRFLDVGDRVHRLTAGPA